VQPLPVAADPDHHVVVEECLGEADERVRERARVGWRRVRPRRDLRLDQRFDARHRSRLDRPSARGQQPQRAVTLLLEQRSQRRRARETAVYTIEDLQQAVCAPAPDRSTVVSDEPLELTADDLAKQLVARSEPAIDRRSPQTEPARNHREVDALTRQVLLARLAQHILA
jgi:hypothetical protein